MAKPRNYWNLETMNQYCEEIRNGYKVIDIKKEFISGKKHLFALVKCPNENHDSYWIAWHSFLKGIKCKLCYYEENNKILWSHEKVIGYYAGFNLKIININDWKNVDDSIECEDENGFKYKMSISSLRQNKHGACIFHKFNPFSLYNLKLYCKLYRPDYELLSDKYIDIKTDYLWRYTGDLLPDSEDKEFAMTADCFVNGDCSHPYFSKSNGEIIFEQLLKHQNIKYIRQKKFKNCKDKKYLRFDFYIPELNLIIEIDGLQHSMVIEYWGGEKGYLDRVKKDQIKNDYCKLNNIDIIRINYFSNKKDLFINNSNLVIQEILYKITMKKKILS